PEAEILVSLKSVNHRGLDLHFHMPPELDGLEAEIRNIIKGGVGRGHMQINVTVTRAGGGAASLNRELFDLYLQAFREAAEKYQITGDPDLNAALQIPGMLSAGSASELSESMGKAVLETVVEAVTVLNAFREREGAATAEEMRLRCRNIENLVGRMEEIRSGAIPAFQKRL